MFPVCLKQRRRRLTLRNLASKQQLPHAKKQKTPSSKQRLPTLAARFRLHSVYLQHDTRTHPPAMSYETRKWFLMSFIRCFNVSVQWAFGGVCGLDILASSSRSRFCLGYRLKVRDRTLNPAGAARARMRHEVSKASQATGRHLDPAGKTNVRRG